MVPRWLVLILVFGLILLLVAVAVLAAFQSLMAALGDATAATALRWIATACLILLLGDVLLLLLALGLRAASEGD